jgi:hypothetical protein
MTTTPTPARIVHRERCLTVTIRRPDMCSMRAM